MSSDNIRKDFDDAMNSIRSDNNFANPENMTSVLVGLCAANLMEISAQLSDAQFPLRDRIAISAMQGLFSNNADEFWVENNIAMDNTAERAYRWADALVKARGGKDDNV